jgi:hypothetical protein
MTMTIALDLILNMACLPLARPLSRPIRRAMHV